MPPVPAAGVPTIDAVPLPLSRNDRPAGTVLDPPESLGVGAGTGEPPFASTTNVLAVPTWDVVLAGLLNFGGMANVNATSGSFALAVLSWRQPSLTIPSATCTRMLPDLVMPETDTL